MKHLLVSNCEAIKAYIVNGIKESVGMYSYSKNHPNVWLI